MLYEEETVEVDSEGIVSIRDHNKMKILYDASAHDLHVILNKIAEVCSFYFHFRIKHDVSVSKQKDKGIFQDAFDRETLIDLILSLEAK